MTNIRWPFVYALPVCIGLLSACPAARNGTFGNSGGDGGSESTSSWGQGGAASSSSSGQNGEGGSLFGDGGLPGTGGGGGGSSGCSEEAKLIYIIGQDNKFYSFNPPTLAVTLKGVLSCPAGLATPFSMAVDRNGIAWVLFSDGRIYHVDVNTVACTATAYVPNQAGFSTFGMGFVSDSAGSEKETLYVADYLGAGLAKIDTNTLKLSVVGPWDKLPGLAAELTGTGDARLYGFFNDSQIIIAGIDKQNANIISQAPQPSVQIGSGWAFAFWGGDFWLFTSPTGDTQIDRYSPVSGTTTTVKTNLGTNIVGAGVSTCAPIVPPN
jgi:hypothetical protein